MIKPLVKEVELFLAGNLTRTNVCHFLNYLDILDDIESRYVVGDCVRMKKMLMIEVTRMGIPCSSDPGESMPSD